MAEKRMFSKKVISSDAFLDMSATAQLFYFHLSMMADDDGFVDSTRSVMRSVGATPEDMNVLIEKKFIIYFSEEGVAVIRHWNISNSIRSDRYKETRYKKLKSRLSVDEDGAYTLQEGSEPGTEPQPTGDRTATNGSQNVSLGERRSDQVNLDQDQKREREEASPDFSVDDTLHPGKKDIVSRVDHHRKHWESCQLPPAPVIVNMDELNRIKPTTDSFTVEKIDEAITNFSAVVLQPNFNADILPGGHIPNFKNFLIRWVDRFTNEAKPLEVYGPKAKAKPPPGRGPDWGGAVLMGNGVKARKFKGGT
jgi:hypothetical protein